MSYATQRFTFPLLEPIAMGTIWIAQVREFLGFVNIPFLKCIVQRNRQPMMLGKILKTLEHE